jgi:predicted PurR-regulated permease PerM
MMSWVMAVVIILMVLGVFFVDNDRLERLIKWFIKRRNEKHNSNRN